MRDKIAVLKTDAIREYLAVRDDLLDGAVVREVEITP